MTSRELNYLALGLGFGVILQAVATVQRIALVSVIVYVAIVCVVWAIRK